MNCPTFRIHSTLLDILTVHRAQQLYMHLTTYLLFDTDKIWKTASKTINNQ